MGVAGIHWILSGDEDESLSGDNPPYHRKHSPTLSCVKTALCRRFLSDRNDLLRTNSANIQTVGGRNGLGRLPWNSVV